jgi:hypothetical protein
MSFVREAALTAEDAGCRGPTHRAAGGLTMLSPRAHVRVLLGVPTDARAPPGCASVRASERISFVWFSSQAVFIEHTLCARPPAGFWGGMATG